MHRFSLNHCTSALIKTNDPFGENLIAFDSRLIMICWVRRMSILMNTFRAVGTNFKVTSLI